MVDLIVRDETMAGRVIEEWVLPGLPERITARELVRLRVREEVARFNAGPATFRGLVQPAAARPERLDWEAQADVACAGFGHNAFVMIVGDRQIEDLDETIDLTTPRAVSFIRLFPLVGG